MADADGEVCPPRGDGLIPTEGLAGGGRCLRASKKSRSDAPAFDHLANAPKLTPAQRKPVNKCSPEQFDKMAEDARVDHHAGKSIGLRADGQNGGEGGKMRCPQRTDRPHGGADGDAVAGRASGGKGGVEHWRETGVQAPASAFIHDEEGVPVACPGGGLEFRRRHAGGIMADAGKGDHQILAPALGQFDAKRGRVAQAGQCHRAMRGAIPSILSAMSALMRAMM